MTTSFPALIFIKYKPLASLMGRLKFLLNSPAATLSLNNEKGSFPKMSVILMFNKVCLEIVKLISILSSAKLETI